MHKVIIKNTPKICSPSQQHLPNSFLVVLDGLKVLTDDILYSVFCFLIKFRWKWLENHESVSCLVNWLSGSKAFMDTTHSRTLISWCTANIWLFMTDKVFQVHSKWFERLFTFIEKADAMLHLLDSCGHV